MNEIEQLCRGRVVFRMKEDVIKEAGTNMSKPVKRAVPFAIAPPRLLLIETRRLKSRGLSLSMLTKPSSVTMNTFKTL